MKHYLISIASALVLSACLGNDIVVDSAPGETVSPPVTETPTTPAVACKDLCRLEDPADTLSLSSEQKERTRQLLDDTLNYSRAGILRMDTSSIKGDSLRLEIFPDVVLTMQLKETPATNPDSRNLTGEIVGAPGGSVMLSFVNGNLVLGSFQYGDKFFFLSSLGDGLVLVRESQILGILPDCHEFDEGGAACW